MNAARDIVAARRWPETLRWGACFALALGFHAAGAAALLAHWSEDSDLVANAPVVMIELAPLPVALDITPTEVPPDTVLSKEAEPEPEPPKPIEKVEMPPAPQAEMEVVPPPKPLEKKVEKKPKQKHAQLNSSAPSTAEQKADRAAAPSPGASSHNPNALPNWKSELVARLEGAKRYPSEAQSRGEQGVAQLAFSVDRSGGVHNARIAHSSGSSALDSATLALVERAAPLPSPPPEVAGAQIAISVPIRYNIHR
jgi:protein TonB